MVKNISKRYRKQENFSVIENPVIVQEIENTKTNKNKKQDKIIVSENNVTEKTNKDE